MKHELLSPAGDMESLYQAINNGCDAIYAGLISWLKKEKLIVL